MKIPEEKAQPQTRWTTNSASETSRHFERELKKAETRSDRALPRQRAKDDQEQQAVLLAPDVTSIPLATQPTEQPEPVQVSSSLISPDVMDIENLASEIVEELRDNNYDCGTQSVDIQFDSKTLEGLHVRVAGPDGVLSITFSTQSDKVAELLSQRISELAKTLEHDGYTVGHIRVANTPRARASRNQRNQLWKR